MNALIEVEDLNKVYSAACCKRKNRPKDALEKTSFYVTEHECFSLLGENGAGKSTSFKILTNEIRKSGGTVRLLGLDADSNNSVISKEMGYCPQDSVLFDLLTVEEHLYFYARLRCLTGRKAHIDALIETL
jgi:ATP-binding cassette subfamily A (ABC1) protein 1